MKRRIWLLLPLLALLLSACVPASMADSTANAGSSLRYVWVQTYNLSMEEWRVALFFVPFWLFLALVVAGSACAFFFTAGSYGGQKTFGAFFVGVLAVSALGAFASGSNIVNQAPEQVQAAADKNSIEGMNLKKKEVAFRYAELVNYQFTDLLPNDATNFGADSEVVKVCGTAMDSRTNCWPYEFDYYSHSTYTCVERDEDTNACTRESETKHYKHEPYVAYLIKYAGVANLPDKYSSQETSLFPRGSNPDQPLMYFSDWMLPWDYTQHWYSGRAESVNKNLTPADYTAPTEWSYYATLTLMGSTSWHRYSNPLLATANEDFVGDPALIAKLEEAGMLLEPRDLYSLTGGNVRTMFDFVYPLGTLASQPGIDWDGMRAGAGTVNTYYGNVYHISNSFAFVHERDLVAQGVTIDGLLYSIKADLYNESKWFKDLNGERLFTIMQQNTILVLCTVQDGTDGALVIPPTGCRVMSGLPIGNETLKQAFLSGLPAELQNMRLTPQSFFGQPQLIAAGDGTLSLIGTEGSPLYLWVTYGAKKPSMEENFGYLVDRIVLTSAQIEEVVTSGVAAQREIVMKLYYFPLGLLALEVLLGLAAFAAANNR